MRPVDPPSEEALADDWDAVASRRLEQIDQHLDVSVDHVLLPTILELLGDALLAKVLDVGCGVGHFAAAIASIADYVCAIDISKKSIVLANERFGELTNVCYQAIGVEEFAARGDLFTAAYANMTLMNFRNLPERLRDISRCLESGGTFVFTITHPWFWPAYWGYADLPWFEYDAEVAIRSPFKITNDIRLDLETVHFHRPLAYYSKALGDAGFNIEIIVEPVPSTSAPRNYREAWRFPRFLAMRCRKA